MMGQVRSRRLSATIIIVTHYHAVGRQADRVITLHAQISDDQGVEHPYEEGLKAFHN